MDIQLQTILEPNKDICDEEALYFHRNCQEICYDGYFNLFYIEKWKRYTDIERLYVKLKIKGYKTLRLYHNRECVKEIQLNSEMEEKYHAEFPLEQFQNGVFWFSLVQNEDVPEHMLSGYYMGACSKSRKVAIGIDICTYKRENYVLRNLKVLCENVLKNHDLQVADSLWVYIIDNGKTLDSFKPIQSYISKQKDRVSVIPNRNAGGAGGFTRGMLEVLKEKEEKKLTHVMLMDDDAVIEPDMFVRVNGFLSMVKEDWKDITVGGMMFREAKPYILYAAGEMWDRGIMHITNSNKDLDLREYENASCDNLLTTKLEKSRYSGWWCCCYSLNVVREDNLPIPLFLHHDDIEFGLRNIKYGVVFLNGVNVWHKSFDDEPPKSILYYDSRNDMIEATQQYDMKNATKIIWQTYYKRLGGLLIRNMRHEATWTIKGAEDFLKGSEWLWNQDPEKLHNQIKKIDEVSFIKLWYESAKICLKLLVQRKKAVIDYQTNIKRYTTKQAWYRYLCL